MSVLFEGDTDHEHYEVADVFYEGRRARVLYSGHRAAAQSGVPLDGNPEMLFDYNQRFMELALGVRPERVLVVGGGVYTFPRALLAALPRVSIDVVELDAGLDAIAEAYFDTKPNDKLQIFHSDGRAYINRNVTLYDLVIVDAFNHSVIPKQLTTLEAVTQLRRSVRSGGVVAVNIIAAYRGYRAQVLRQQTAVYSAVFDDVQIFPASRGYSEWQSQNFVLVARKGATHHSMAGLRYPALPKLEVSSQEIIYDKDIKLT